MTRIMRKNGNAETTAPAPPDKVASYEIGEDEAGMRLDRWLHRRFPEVSNSHLMRIVRKGEVRVSGKRADISTRLATGESVRVPPLKIAPQKAPTLKRADPGDSRGDPRDDFVRGSRRAGAQQALRPRGPGRLGDQAPYRRHASGARRQGGQQARSRSSAGSRHVGRAADRQNAKDGGGAWRNLPLAPREEDLLGAGRGRAEAGAGADLDVSRQGRGHGGNARAGQGGPRAHAGREARRSRRPAFTHPLCGRRQGHAASGVAVDAPGHRPHPSVARPLRRDRPSDHRRSEIQPSAQPTIRPGTIRCAPFRLGSNPSFIFWRAGWSCPIRAAESST